MATGFSASGRIDCANPFRRVWCAGTDYRPLRTFISRRVDWMAVDHLFVAVGTHLINHPLPAPVSQRALLGRRITARPNHSDGRHAAAAGRLVAKIRGRCRPAFSAFLFSEQPGRSSRGGWRRLLPRPDFRNDRHSAIDCLIQCVDWCAGHFVEPRGRVGGCRFHYSICGRTGSRNPARCPFRVLDRGGDRGSFDGIRGALLAVAGAGFWVLSAIKSSQWC